MALRAPAARRSTRSLRLWKDPNSLVTAQMEIKTDLSNRAVLNDLDVAKG
jgi:hypothetical protein